MSPCLPAASPPGPAGFSSMAGSFSACSASAAGKRAHRPFGRGLGPRPQPLPGGRAGRHVNGRRSLRRQPHPDGPPAVSPVSGQRLKTLARRQERADQPDSVLVRDQPGTSLAADGSCCKGQLCYNRGQRRGCHQLAYIAAGAFRAGRSVPEMCNANTSQHVAWIDAPGPDGPPRQMEDVGATCREKENADGNLAPFRKEVPLRTQTGVSSLVGSPEIVYIMDATARLVALGRRTQAGHRATGEDVLVW